MSLRLTHHVLQCRLATPLGAMTATRSVRGLSGLWFDAQKHHPGALDLPSASDDAVFAQLRAALRAYFEGQGLPQDLALDPQGTPFQQQVWQALLAIPAGDSRSYGQLARQLGRPLAVRALGAAVGRNPLSILIPCHRALGAGGALTGYAGGLARKTALLRLEGASFKEAD